MQIGGFINPIGIERNKKRNELVGQGASKRRG